jgi:hypothetical protein
LSLSLKPAELKDFHPVDELKSLALFKFIRNQTLQKVFGSGRASENYTPA